MPPDDDGDELKHAYSSMSPANTGPSKRRLPNYATKTKQMSKGKEESGTDLLLVGISVVV